MKNYCVDVLPQAQKDIIEVLDYIALELCSPLAALDLHKAIADTLERLESFPLMGTELKVELPLGALYRWVRVENYMIFYTFSEESETVYVSRVLFASSNYLSVL